eukprot:COSAG02_NODE_44423_length_366_cov_0.970037_1_plen_85_part_10
MDDDADSHIDSRTSYDHLPTRKLHNRRREDLCFLSESASANCTNGDTTVLVAPFTVQFSWPIQQNGEIARAAAAVDVASAGSLTS